MSIKNELDVIGQTWVPQNASKVRQAIHDILIKTYDTASENGNANMEVEIARGTHPNLRSRLEEVDNKQKQAASQLAQTSSKLLDKAEKSEVMAVSNEISDIIAHAGDGTVPTELINVRTSNLDGKVFTTSKQRIDSEVHNLRKSISDITVEDSLIDCTNPDITYTGNWSLGDGPDYNNTNMASREIGDSIEYTFVGTGIYIFDRMARNKGTVEIFLNGVSQGKFDRYSSTIKYSQLVFQKTNLEYGYHRIKIVIINERNESSSGDSFALDYFRVFNKTVSDLLRKSISDITVEDSFIDSTNSEIIYTGDWTLGDGPDYNNTNYSSIKIGDSIEYTFVGTGIYIYDRMGPNRGTVEIFLNGVSQGKSDRYSSTIRYMQLVFQKTNLEYGYHRIKIVITNERNESSSGNTFAFDYFRVVDKTMSDLKTKIPNNLDVSSLSQFKLLTDKSPNLFNPSTAIEGYAMLNGELVPIDPRATSDFIEIDYNTQYIKNQTTAAEVSLFDENKNYIQEIEAINGVITIPNDPAVKYLRFFVNTDLIDINQVMLVKGEFPNLFNPSTAIEGYYISNGTLVERIGRATSDYIEVDYNTQYIKNQKDTAPEVSLFDENKNFIQQINAVDGVITIPNDPAVKYLRFFVNTDLIDINQVMLNSTILPSDFIPFYGKTFTIEGLVTENDENKSHEKEYVPYPYYAKKLNPPKPLFIPTYNPDGDHAIHPKVLYFPEKWNGYKFWLTFTPYTKTNEAIENPSIAVSNNGIDWGIPEGLTNPLDIPLDTIRTHNSDSHLVYNHDTDTLECWWRFSTKPSQPDLFERIYRRTTKDGINWTPKELLKESLDTITGLQSPAVNYEDGKYRIWYSHSINPDRSRRIVKYEESIDGTNWQFVRDIVLAQDAEGPLQVLNHLDVVKVNGVYKMVGSKTYQGSTGITYMTSTDNVTYTEPVEVLKRGHPDSWDGVQCYRPSITIVDGHEYLYYSGRDKHSNWGTGLIIVDDIGNMREYGGLT